MYSRITHLILSLEKELDQECGRDLALSFGLDASVDFEHLTRQIERSKSHKESLINR